MNYNLGATNQNSWVTPTTSLIDTPSTSFDSNSHYTSFAFDRSTSYTDTIETSQVNTTQNTINTAVCLLLCMLDIVVYCNVL